MVGHRIDRLRAVGLSAGRRGWRATRGSLDEEFARSRADFYARMWQEAADAVGARLEELGDGFRLACRGEAETLVWRDLVMLDHPANAALAGHKPLVLRLLRAEGLPVPEQVSVGPDGLDAAVAFLRRHGGPCVVKPANGTGGGAGVTCGVMTTDDLWRAWLGAGVWDRTVMVERQVEGDEYRLLFLDGELVDAVRRRRPSVRGDGRSSVAELIDAENRRRLGSSGHDVALPIRLDLDCELALRAAGLSARSVPVDGEVVTVKCRSSEGGVGDRFTVRDLAPALIEDGARAVRAVRLRLAGVDVVVTDPSRPLLRGGGTILEVNCTPGLHHHYQVADPDRATRVAVPLLELLLGEAAGTTVRG